MITKITQSYKIYLAIFLMVISTSTSGKSYQSDIVTLGSPTGNYNFVYLGGLIDSFDSELEISHRNILDKIGKELNIKFLVPVPKNRSARFSNKLHWPQDDEFVILDTFNKIMSELEGTKIGGWIGFSNGGYFLQELLHYNSLDLPIITIGAAGRMDHQTQINILIGKDDTHAYDRAKNFGYKFIEYDGSHEIEYSSLKNLLTVILKK